MKDDPYRSLAGEDCGWASAVSPRIRKDALFGIPVGGLCAPHGKPTDAKRGQKRSLRRRIKS
jgi:hypothetical protein